MKKSGISGLVVLLAVFLLVAGALVYFGSYCTYSSRYVGEVLFRTSDVTGFRLKVNVPFNFNRVFLRGSVQNCTNVYPTQEKVCFPLLGEYIFDWAGGVLTVRDSSGLVLATTPLSAGETTTLFFKKALFWDILSVSAPMSAEWDTRPGLCAQESLNPPVYNPKSSFVMRTVDETIAGRFIPGYDYDISIYWDGDSITIRDGDRVCADKIPLSAGGVAYVDLTIGIAYAGSWRISADPMALVASQFVWYGVRGYLDNVAEYQTFESISLYEDAGPISLSGFGKAFRLRFDGTHVFVESDDRGVLASLGRSRSPIRSTMYLVLMNGKDVRYIRLEVFGRPRG